MSCNQSGPCNSFKLQGLADGWPSRVNKLVKVSPGLWAARRLWSSSALHRCVCVMCQNDWANATQVERPPRNGPKEEADPNHRKQPSVFPKPLDQATPKEHSESSLNTQSFFSLLERVRDSWLSDGRASVSACPTLLLLFVCLFV